MAGVAVGVVGQGRGHVSVHGQAEGSTLKRACGFRSGIVPGHAGTASVVLVLSAAVLVIDPRWGSIRHDRRFLATT